MRRALRFGPFLALSLPLLAASSCDDDDHPPFVDPGGTSPPPIIGGGTGGGGGGGDVSTDADGGLAASCEVTPLTILEDAIGADLDFDVAGGADDFVVAFTESRNGVEDVFSRRIDETGVLGDEQRVTDDAALARDPAVVATDSGFLVAFSDAASEADDFEVRARAIDATGVPAGDAALVSSTVADDLDAALVESATPGESILAFRSVDALDFTQTNAAVVDVVDDQAVVAGFEQPVADVFEVGGALDLAALGVAPTTLASFVDAAGDLQLFELTSTGTAASTPITVRSGADFTQVFDLAAGESGGIVVLGFDRGSGDPALAVRTIDTQGDLDGETPLFIDSSVTGRSPAAIALDDGFAVAFRRTTSLGTTIRLVFLDAVGNVLAERDVAVTRLAAGGLRLARADDGALLVVFDEPFGAGVSLRGVRAVCP